MDNIDTLIEEFNAERTSNLEKIDSSRKAKIVSILEDYADDHRVSDFFFRVALNEQEYDLARIEVFKILEVNDFANLDVRNMAANVICKVLSHCQDEDVLNYAAMAAASYMHYESVVAEVERILLDTAQPANLRWNAFAAIKTLGVSQRSSDLLRSLLVDDEFKKSAARVLSEWASSG